jgi:hypothetical protein
MRLRLTISALIVVAVAATFLPNLPAFERDTARLLAISVNKTISEDTDFPFVLRNVSEIKSISALVYGQIEQCEDLKRTQRPGLMCGLSATYGGLTVDASLNGNIRARSLTWSPEPLTALNAPIREVFYRFDIAAIVEGENKITLSPITPRFIERIEVWASPKS